MVLLADLHLHLNELLQCSLFQDYGPNGIQVEGKPQIERVATAVTANLETIKAAVQAGVQALIVHHGLFWNGDSMVLTGAKRDKIELLLRHGISLLAYHLPLDAHQEVGNNWKAAQEMGWKDLEPFGMYKGSFIGVKGKVSAMPRKKFQHTLENYYLHPAICAFGGKEEIQTAALISGGAYKIMSEAIDAKVDCFITGNFDEPAWDLAHEGKINFFALGHSATERIGPRALSDYLKQQFKISSQFIDTTNPF